MLHDAVDIRPAYPEMFRHLLTSGGAVSVIRSYLQNNRFCQLGVTRLFSPCQPLGMESCWMIVATRHLAFVQVSPVLIAFRKNMTVGASLFVHIVGVVRTCSKKQVSRIDASRIISARAVVQNKKTLGDFPEVNMVGETMGGYIPTVRTPVNQSVTVMAFGMRPEPAPMRTTGLIYLLPEASNEGGGDGDRIGTHGGFTLRCATPRGVCSTAGALIRPTIIPDGQQCA